MVDSDTDFCGATAKSTGEPCQRPAGWGTESDSGRCKFHGGQTPSGDEDPDVGNGDQDGNTNAVRHGFYAENHNFYQNVLDDAGRAFVDRVLADYISRYEDANGRPPTTGEEAHLFDVAVGQAKTLRGENWVTERPDELDSGNDLVDREVHISESGERYYRYKETVVMAPKQKLSRERRAVLKDYGLLDDPESKTAEAIDQLDGIEITFSESEGSEASDS